MANDPRIVRLETVLTARPAVRLPRAGDRAEAAVAVVLRPALELEILFIRRALHETDPWSGHTALPGGRRDGADPDLLDTALRETREETGLDLRSAGRVLGGLDEIAPASRHLPPLIIRPFVLAAPAGATAHPASREVDAAFWIPLRDLRDEGAVSELLLELRDERLCFPTRTWNGHVIWGLTHRILDQFLDVARRAGI